ncbi:MAG: response regulator transcription factor [Pseudanabaenaceae cyanobacterium bins.68]|nr:response regulator transcription factor [Pseudanabaenaceae cyanobacterium bins.68]
MRLLLVDDELELTAPLQRLLTGQGYEVDIAMDGDRGWEYATQGGYNLVILDWMMPKRSGLDICRGLRQQGDLTPVLFLTAKDTLDDRVLGLDCGADDYLVKPFELRELLARIRALLRRNPGADSYLTYQNLSLDQDSRLLCCQDQKVLLSEQEAKLLAYMIRRPGQLLTHEQLEEHLWQTKPPSNALVAQIKLLRRKLEPLAQLQPGLITTVYGKGYRFG